MNNVLIAHVVTTHGEYDVPVTEDDGKIDPEAVADGFNKAIKAGMITIQIGAFTFFVKRMVSVSVRLYRR